MDFTTLASEHLVNQAAKLRFMFGGNATVPIVLRTPAGSGTGAVEHHSQSLENWFVHIADLKVVDMTPLNHPCPNSSFHEAADA